MKKKASFPKIITIIAIVVILIGVFGAFSGALGWGLKDDEKCRYKINSFDIVVNSEDSDYYDIKASITLYNLSDEVEGTLVLTLEDQHKNRCNATFGNVKINPNTTHTERVECHSVKTADEDDGLDYDIKVVGVTLAGREFVKYSIYNNAFSIVVLVGVVLLIVAKVVKNKAKSDEDEVEVSNTVDSQRLGELVKEKIEEKKEENRCKYCGCLLDESDKKCSNCGAPRK